MLRRSTVALLTMLLFAPAARAQVDRLDPVAARARVGDDRAALERFDALPARVRRTPRARYLHARLLERVGRLREAAEAYPLDEDAETLPERARRDARQRAAAAFAGSGAPADALPLLEGSTDPLDEARRAECLLALGRIEQATAALRGVVARGAGAVDLFAARSELAEALVRGGDSEGAQRILTELIIERPEHPQAADAEATLSALNGGPPELSYAQTMRAIDGLARARRYPEAIARLRAVPMPSSLPERRRYLHTLGMTLYRARHHFTEAAEVLGRSAAAGGSHATEDAFHAARALSRDDRDTEAITAYRAFARAHRGHARAAEASYLAAWLEIRHGVAAGERNMRRFSRSRAARSHPRFRQDATWQLGLRAFERGQHRRAAGLFEEYAGLGAGALIRGRGLYWTGRAREEAGDRAGAVASYQGALYVEPLHYYAMLARQRLEALGESTPSPFPEPPEAGATPSAAVELPEDVAFFAELGLRHDARQALRRHERALRREGRETLAAAYSQLGEPNRLVRLFGGPATTGRRHAPGPADRWRWDAAYPRPWPGPVGIAARAVGLSPAHLYSVMRQESGYDPDAVSYADAIGLMQLLPATAERVGRRLGMEVEREMLFDPAINAQLGAAYVSALIDRFGVPLAFSAFNAGEHRVDAWLTARGETPLDLFVERIPYTQTRNYTRRVTTHLAHYRYLEDPSAGWPLTLPETVAPHPGED